VVATADSTARESCAGAFTETGNTPGIIDFRVFPFIIQNPGPDIAAPHFCNKKLAMFYCASSEPGTECVVHYFDFFLSSRSNKHEGTLQV
jgi:hypothetical protein